MAGAFTHNGNVVEGLPSIASQINYSNTSSGMQATQVQAAIDELNTNKQPKTDNNLTTTSKETTGAINELKSGLTDVNNKFASYEKVSKIDIGGTSATATIPLETTKMYTIDISMINSASVYNHYNVVVRYVSGGWKIGELEKLEKDSSHIALSFSMADNNFTITNGGDWGTVLLCKVASVTV